MLLAELPVLLRTILAARLEDEDRLDLISLPDDGTDFSEAFREHKPDVVITDGDRSQLARALESIVDNGPRLKLLAVSQHGRRACMYEVIPTRRELGEPLPSELVRTLLDALRDGSSDDLDVAIDGGNT